MGEGVEQVNYFKTGVLMVSKNRVTTGTAQVATQQSQVTAGTAQGTTCEIVRCSSGGVCGGRRVGLKPSTVGETARGPLAASTASQAGLTAVPDWLNLSHPSPLPGMTQSLPTPTGLPRPLAPKTEAPDTYAPDTTALATTKPETDWEREVWKWVELEFDELKKKMPLSKAEGACGVICHPSTDAHMKEFTRCLTEHGEYRNVVSNLCDTPPAMTSVPGDSILVATLPDMAAFRFYKDGKPCAPTMWPKDSNIPVALYRCEMPKSGEAERFGKDGVVHAFWWSFAQAVKAHKAAVDAAPPTTTCSADASKWMDGIWTCYV